MESTLPRVSTDELRPVLLRAVEEQQAAMVLANAIVRLLLDELPSDKLILGTVALDMAGDLLNHVQAQIPDLVEDKLRAQFALLTSSSPL